MSCKKDQIKLGDKIFYLGVGLGGFNSNSITGSSCDAICKKYYLAQIMDESSELEPFLIRVFSPDPLSSLECMHRVGQIYVWIRFINHVIQFVQGLKNCGLKVIELEPFVVLKNI